jgi:ABC-type dipeptide/oligopeptide/nickel transport system permease subunit
MLQDASNVRMMGDAPWLLAPAVALFIVVLALQLAGTSFHAGRELGPRPGL